MKKVIISLLVLGVCMAGQAQEIKRIKITDLEKIITESKTPLVINFWATFCLPCLAELPYFHSMQRKYEKDNVQLLLVSLDLKDDISKIAAFAKKRKITAPIAWLDETNADYFIPRLDSLWSGSIPATLFINNKMSYRKFMEQEFSEEQLEKEFKAVIKND